MLDQFFLCSFMYSFFFCLSYSGIFSYWFFLYSLPNSCGFVFLQTYSNTNFSNTFFFLPQIILYLDLYSFFKMINFKNFQMFFCLFFSFFYVYYLPCIICHHYNKQFIFLLSQLSIFSLKLEIFILFAASLFIMHQKWILKYFFPTVTIIKSLKLMEFCVISWKPSYMFGINWSYSNIYTLLIKFTNQRLRKFMNSICCCHHLKQI